MLQDFDGDSRGARTDPRAFSQPILGADGHSLEIAKPATRGGPCGNLMYLAVMRFPKIRALVKREILVSRNGLICAGFGPFRAG